MSKSECVHCTFFDFEKAFDTVNHKMLLEKCNAYGLRGKVGKILQSYLSNRKQFVEIVEHKISREMYYNWGSAGIRSWPDSFSDIYKRLTSNRSKRKPNTFCRRHPTRTKK